jgi:hypothetical protein
MGGIMTPDECIKRYGSHDLVTQPGGVEQRNPYTGKKTILRVQICSRCRTSEMFFEDIEDDEEEE